MDTIQSPADAQLLPPLVARVVSHSSCEGSATLSTSRGVVRRGWDFGFTLHWEVCVEPERGVAAATTEGALCKGKLVFSDVTRSDLSEATVKIVHDAEPAGGVSRRRLGIAVDALREAVKSALGAFADELGTQTM